MRWLPGTRILTWVDGTGFLRRAYPLTAERRADPGADSARRPAQRTAAENVEVEVWHQVAGVRTDVEHQAIAAPPGGADVVGHEALIPSDLLRQQDQIDQILGILATQVVRGRDVTARHDQDVGRRLRVDVSKGKAPVRRSHLGRGKLPGDNSAEETFRHRPTRPSSGRALRSPSWTRTPTSPG